MKNNFFKIGVIGAFALVISCGNAQEKSNDKKPPTFKVLLKEMDVNEDGKLSKEEVKGPLKESFAKIDTDEDGFISETEFKKAPKPKRPQGDRPQ